MTPAWHPLGSLGSKGRGAWLRGRTEPQEAIEERDRLVPQRAREVAEGLQQGRLRRDAGATVGVASDGIHGHIEQRRKPLEEPVDDGERGAAGAAIIDELRC